MYTNIQFQVVLTLFFLSGAASLIFQVVWMRELHLLFGSTAQASAATLSAFFLGLASGSGYWGVIARKLKNPLRIYGLLELAITFAALSIFLLKPLLQHLQRAYLVPDSHPAILLVLKLAGAIFLLFAPTFLMGGTLPLIAQVLVRTSAQFGRNVSMAYGLNTLGAALGAYLAGFHLPEWFGFKATCRIAMCSTALAGLLALLLSRGKGAPVESSVVTIKDYKIERWIYFLAALSGFCTLALEVMWTRMFAQVLQNSIYTYGLILVVFLLALGLGSLLAHVLGRSGWNRSRVLQWLLLLAGFGSAVSGYLFVYLTDGMDYLGDRETFGYYLLLVFAISTPVVLIPCLFMGAILPWLLHMVELKQERSGWVVGRLVAINTLAAVLGSLWAGFIALPTLGLWFSVCLTGALYLVGIVLVPDGIASNSRRWIYSMVAIAPIIVVARLLPLPVVPPEEGRTCLEVWEGSLGTVAVTRANRNLEIRVNNFYTLGSTKAAFYERFQGHLPLLLHPKPRDIFVLGLGTGITAGAVLSHPVESLIVCELIPEVLSASEKYFSDYTNGLFTDRRVGLYAQDGRHFLEVSRQYFDVIVSDLFVPWEAGTASLYSVEQYRSAANRLRSKGIYAQWLPLYQVSELEFASIARSMLEVFPTVTLWRGDFEPRRSIALLLGHRTAPAYPADFSGQLEMIHSKAEPFGRLQSTLAETKDFVVQRLLGMFYCGALDRSQALFSLVPLNTDDRSYISYRAPITQREVQSGKVVWFSGEPFVRFTDRQLIEPLKNFKNEELLLEAAQLGAHLHAIKVLTGSGQSEEAKERLKLLRQQINPAP